MLIKNNALKSNSLSSLKYYKKPLGITSVLLGAVSFGLGISLDTNVGHADVTPPTNNSELVNSSKQDQKSLSQPNQAQTLNDNKADNQGNVNNSSQNNISSQALSTEEVKAQGTQANQSVNQAKIDSFDWVMQGTDKGVQDQTVQNAQRFGFKANITLTADQVNHAQTIHLFRMNQISNNKGVNSFDGMTSYYPENSGSSLYYQGKYLGNITATPHYINNVACAWPIADYVDYYLNISNPIQNAIGEQKISINDLWTGTFDYVSPYSFRGIDSSNLTFNFVGNGLNKNYNVTYHWNNVNENVLSKDNPAMTTSNYQSVPGTTLADGGHARHYNNITYPGWDNQDEVNKYNENNGKNGTVDINSNLQLASRNYATNGNKLLLDQKIGEEKALSFGNLNYPIVGLHGEVYQEIDPEIAAYDLEYNRKRVADNLSLDQLKALNYVGAVVSQQDDGSIIEYLNIPLKALTLPQYREEATYNALLERSFLINHLAKNDTEAVKMAQNTLNNIKNGPLKGLPAFGLLFDYDFHLNDSQEKTTVKSDTLNPLTGDIVQTTDQTNYQNFFAKEGQAQVNIHYISGVNGVELSKTSQNIGDKNATVNFSIPSINNYYVRLNHDGSNTVQLLNGKNISLPEQGTTISTNQGLKYPADSSVKNYYVILDPVSANETYQFVDDNNNGSQLGTPVIINGYLNESKPLSLTIPTGYKLAKGQNIPTNATLENKTVLIHLVHDTESVSRNVTVKRIINYLEKDTNKELAKPVTQEVTFRQVGIKDLVTGNVEWLSSDDTQTLNEITSPEIEGYEKPDIVKVNNEKVTMASQNQLINVYYAKKAQPKVEINTNQNHTPSSSSDIQNNATNKNTTVALPNNINSALQKAPINANNSSIILPTKQDTLAQTNVNDNTNTNELALVGLALVNGTLILNSVKKKEE